MRESLRQFFKSKSGKILSLVFVLGFLYLILPGPGRIEDFPPLPVSIKSTLEGDTIQNPNIAAYYANFRRYFITWFYEKEYAKMFPFGWFLKPIVINHPPEEAYQYIRDQQESTFLEEFVYPLRESFYVNGYEPLTQNKMSGREEIVGFVGNHIIVRDKVTGEEKYYDSKTTIRFYPTNPLARVLIYFGIWFLGIKLYKLTREVLKEN